MYSVAIQLYIYILYYYTVGIVVVEVASNMQYIDFVFVYYTYICIYYCCTYVCTYVAIAIAIHIVVCIGKLHIRKVMGGKDYECV